MWYAPATCRYGQTYGWMPYRVGLSGDSVSTTTEGGYTPPNDPNDAGIKKTKDAATLAVKKWAAAYKHAMTYHADYTPALKANTAAQTAENDWATAALGGLNTINLNYADQGGAPKSLTQPYEDAYSAAQQQAKLLQDGRAFLIADMAAHFSLNMGSPASANAPAAAPAQEAAASAVDKTPKAPGTPPPPVSSEDADDPTKPAPPSEAFAGPLEWGQIAGWAAVVGVVGWIFWRTVSGRALA